MLLPYIGCVIRRSTCTITVLSGLSLTTTPTRTLRRMRSPAVCPASSRSFSLMFALLAGGSLLLGQLTLALDRLQPGDVLPHALQRSGILQLHHRRLETELELLLPELLQTCRDLGIVELANLFGLHRTRSLSYYPTT